GGVGGAWGLRRRRPLGLCLGSALGRCASRSSGPGADRGRTDVTFSCLENLKFLEVSLHT
ncbi:unnamed protein product, partial [Gulo gulo]